MLVVKRFVNQLMASNCYVVYDEDTKNCIVIDPASENSLQEILLIEEKGLILDYIVLTHEHTDHNWGVNALRDRYKTSKLICSEICNERVRKTNKACFLFYFNDPNYRYEIAPAEFVVSRQEENLLWKEHNIRFILTPGHSVGSMCIEIEGMLFTGDTIMPFDPYFKKRDGNENDWKKSISIICSRYAHDTLIYPGHGEKLTLGDWISVFSEVN